MEYWKLIFQDIPYILFAHEYMSTHYHLDFPPIPNRFEITFLEQGDVHRLSSDGSEALYPSPGFLFSRFETAYTLESAAPVHRHTTVGVEAAAEIRPISHDEIVAYSHPFYSGEQGRFTAILPTYTAADEQSRALETQLKKIVRTHTIPTNTRGLVCGGMLLELLAAWTEASIRDILSQEDENFSPANMVYASRAMQIIADNLQQKIRVEEIAANLGISAGHLSRIFRQATGQTVVEYINRVKCERVKALLENRNVSLQEACDGVGISDVNYLSRLFKKVTGTTIREYRMLKTALPPPKHG